MAPRPDFSAARRASAARPLLLRAFPFLLFSLALAPRLVAIGRYITPDELVWVYRSLQFREALLDGRWAGTLVAGHPGVTTTWLGALSMTLQMAFSPDGRAAYEWLTKIAALTPDNVEAFRRLALFLGPGRAGVAIVNSLGIVAAYYLVRRLWSPAAAVVAGLLLALDPFLAGLSGLFHVDGLSATFATLALLALAVALGERGRPVIWLAVSGACAGLAALSKSPTLVLLPVAALALLWPALRADGTWRARLLGVVRHGLVWGAALFATVLLLYPALWAGPGGVVEIVGGSANRHLDEALRETFFLGRVAFNHGPLFYPIVVLWRLSPVAWLALAPAVWLLLRRRPAGAWRRSGWFAAGLFVLWAVVFLVAITPAAKKFDRYILPVAPSLLILAGVAWTAWAARARRWGRRALLVVVGAQALFWLAFAAYPLTAYNPLVGGPWTAVRVLPAGWGEGIGAAGRWLARTQPDAAGRAAIAGVPPALAPFFPGRTLVEGLDSPTTADYQIVTLGGRQLDPAGVAAQTAGLELIATERFGGLEQAWVYRRADPRPAAAPSVLAAPVNFGDRLALTALGQDVAGETIALAARWRRLAPAAPDDRYTLRLAVVDTAGNDWAAQESELLNEVYFYPPDWPVDETGVVRYALELPPAIPPGRYQVQMSLIDQRTSGQLPARAGDNPAQSVVRTVGEIEVAPPEEIVSASRVQIAEMSGAKWRGDSLWLLGNSTLPEGALAGSDLAVDLFWHAPTEMLPAGLQLAWKLLPLVDGGVTLPIATVPLSRYDTGLWRVGETIQEKYRLPLPPALRPGRYALLLQPLGVAGSPLGAAERVGELRIDNIDREYTVPMDLAQPLLDTCFADVICLRGATLSAITAAPGQPVELVLYWQALSEPAAVYTAFLHVLNANDETVLPADHWPGGLPSDIWDAGQVVTDRVPLALPSDLTPGEYRLRVGLYNADTGERLPVSSGGVAPDYFILPLTLTVQP